MPEISFEKEALFNRLLEGKLLPGDEELLVQWLGNETPDLETADLIMRHLRNTEGMEMAISDELKERLEQRLPLILANMTNRPGLLHRMVQQRWWRYAAAVVILAGIGFFLLQTGAQKNTPSGTELAEGPDADLIQPGKDGAILTLVDGSTMVLDSLGNGLLTTQNGTKVLLKNGQLVYNAANDQEIVVGYNTMSTPKGRQFQLILPDGTKVWLNAASSIRYPTIFKGDERRVEITGEAYFEVAKNTVQPFRVQVNNETEIEVLGTHFNINSYENEESINTTLLEGSVRVINSSGKIVLRPGQQARSRSQEKIKVLDEVNIEKVMAWKNGLFDFQDATLEEVMRQLERWYDIEVVYEKNIPRLEFYGKMGKDLNLETVLRGLEKSNVHFRIETGRRLVVLP